MTTEHSNWQSLINQPFENNIPQKTAPKNTIVFLDNQSVLEIKGADAAKFLQGQCSADIEKLDEGCSVAGSICTVKGRVLTTFIVTKIGDRILLRMPTELISNIKNYLAKYAAFYKVELLEWPSPCVISAQGYKPKTHSIELQYSLSEKSFTEYLIERQHLDSFLKELDEQVSLEMENIHFYSEAIWQDQQIDSGWLNLTTKTTEDFLPHQLNLEKLDAINFKKGCYTGQEIIARTEYRGKPKRRLHRVKISGLKSPENIELPIDVIDKKTGKSIGKLLAIGKNSIYNLMILPVENDGNMTCLIDEQACDINSSTDINEF